MQFLIHNIWLIMTVLSCALLLAWPTLSRLSGGFKMITPVEAVHFLNRSSAQLIDLRDKKSFEQAHLKQARNIELHELRKCISELAQGENSRFLLYCQHGTQAHIAAGLLKRAGVKEIYCLEGGIKAWQNAGLPVQSGS
ncbi:MAG: rhodanese-like domain-containing protein [Pseudomonadota bacterium]|nr:rhodanese-like domain-containing protein [Pseudomonadota bacterium]